MPAARVIKPKPVEASGKTLERSRPVKVSAVTAARAELQPPAVRKSRASSCPRCPQPRGTAAQRTALRASCERRARSSSTAARTTRTNPDCRTAVKHAAVGPKCRETSAGPVPKDQRGVRAESKHTSYSQKAFTVIPPNPKKRREIQRKAEAELAALEELRLSRAMAYVSINPSTVGGCMSLEEVRSKQQQEMMQAKRKQKPVTSHSEIDTSPLAGRRRAEQATANMKTQLLEQTSVL